jgi:Mrp family chromosome partitioning ATPase
MLAVQMRRRGYRTAILDADVTGPSIPKMFGLKDKAPASELGLFPVETKSGISVISINLLLEDETAPVVWRGPIIAGTVKQFWSDIIWGDVDYMFVDMPPGTGDVPLTVFQSLPLDGIIVVTSPQELVGMIVSKAVNMARMMNIPVFGIVENFSYFQCPGCGEKHAVFGESHVGEAAEAFGIDVLARVPIDPKLAKISDGGLIELYEGDYVDTAADTIEKLCGVKE